MDKIRVVRVHFSASGVSHTCRTFSEVAAITGVDLQDWLNGVQSSAGYSNICLLLEELTPAELYNRLDDEQNED